MKSFSEAVATSRRMSELFSVYETNMIELSKLLNEAINYVKDEFPVNYWYAMAGPRSQAGWSEKLQPKKWAHAVFFNSKVDNLEISDYNQTDWLLVLMILLKENSLNVGQECISLSLLHYNCINKDGGRSMGDEWEFQAIVSMARRDCYDYCLSDWSPKVVRAVKSDGNNVSHLLNIPVGYFESVDDFPRILKPCVSALIAQNGKSLSEIELFVPTGFSYQQSL